MNRIAAVVAGLSLAFVGTSATIAGTINVPGDQPTIAAAISASVNGDVIAIAAGTYNEHSLNPGGKAITIGSASGNLDVTIDAQQGGSVFVVNSGETSGTVIKDLVITGGTGTELGGWNYGGGIFCESSSPTISGCTITGNTAYSGGGIWCGTNSSPTISGCTISGNTASYGGGGITCETNSSPTISGCTISGNTADRDGGGIFIFDSSPTISGCTISGNTGNTGNYSDTSGSGIFCANNSNPTITDCTISGNTAPYGGGGITCSNSNLTLENVMVLGNSTPEVVLDNGSTLTQGNTQQELIAQLQSTIEAQQTAIEDLQQVVTACCAAQSCAGDENNDGVVNIEDLLIIIDAWGPCI